MSSNSAQCYNPRSMKRLLAGFVLCAAMSTFVAAQRGQPQPQKGQPQQRPVEAPAKPVPADDQTISVNVDLVNILFTVADRKGKFVTNLRKDDFRAFEDEKPQNITNFSSETDLPL